MLKICLRISSIIFGMIFILDMVQAEEATKVSQDLHNNEKAMSDTMSYMVHFGYLVPPSSPNASNFSDYEIAEGISLIQQIANLPKTGILDEDTYRFIKSPRCGNSDFKLVEHLRRLRQKRFSIPKVVVPWDTFPITWRLVWPSPKLNLSEVIWDLDRAFHFWSDSTKVQFRRVEGDPVLRGEPEVDIVISFLSGEHGDGYKFYGGTLAHTFIPSGSNALSGDIHLNEDINWMTLMNSKQSKNGVSIFATVVHEIGHSLGLSHSYDEDSIMFPIANEPRSYHRLPEDDQRGIEALYGSKTVDDSSTDVPSATTSLTSESTTSRAPESTPRTPYLADLKQLMLSNLHRNQPIPLQPTVQPDNCPDSIDVITAIGDQLYIFKDEYMWRKVPNGELEGPTLSSSYWLGLPHDIKHIDAAYRRRGTSDTVLFTGNKLWVFNKRNLRPGYPRPLRALGLPRHLTKVDAALSRSDTGATYFFTNKFFYEFDKSRQLVKSKIPHRISSVWDGVKYPVDSAFMWNGSVYFFQGEHYWKFDPTTARVADKKGKLTRTHWLDCPERTSGDVDNFI